MTQYESDRPVSGWAVGGLSFAAALMIMIGLFQALEGLAAIINDDLFVLTKNYAFDLDVTAWGWLHLIFGIIVLLAGWGLLAGRAWAAVTGIVLAMISALMNFFMIPYYPWWSLLVIALDIWVIWALTRPGVLER